MSILVLIFTLCRLLFLVYNNDHFPVVYFTDFLAGLWFDLITVSIAFLPLLIIELIPNIWRGNKWFQLALVLLFHLIVFLTVLINLIDVEYFRHTGARSGYSLIKALGFGNDFSTQVPSIFSSYWPLVIFGFIFQGIAFWLYRRVQRLKEDSAETSWLKQSIAFVVTAAFLVLIGRGGLGMKPISPADAAGYTIDQNVQLVLNSAFNMIKTWGGLTLEEKEYFKEEELKELFTTTRQYPDAPRLDNPNIVILTLESFSVEYVSEINGTDEVCTPFLDSLIRESLVYTNCFANGKKSIDAVPALISSIPKLMEIEYLTSNYAVNRIEGLPKMLKKKGYSSGFFHGAANGSMSFNTFAEVSGFDNYYGMTEYNKDADFDGTWGIFDEEFLSWSADQFDKMPSPFFSTVFTISSHPPYTIPDRYKDRFKGGETEMHDAIAYADFALSQFFKKAKTKDWYSNTLFIVVADHTPASGTPTYYKERGNMHIPLVFHHPSDSTFRGRSDKVVSQADVMPTILHLLGHQEPFFAFGKSIFDDLTGYSCGQVGDKYMYFGTVGEEHYILLLQNEETVGIYNLNDPIQVNNLMDDESLWILEDKLKAMIQTYNHALITNKMTLD